MLLRLAVNFITNSSKNQEITINQTLLFCRFTIDVLQKVKEEVTNSESCVTVKLLHQKSNKEAIRQ